MPLLTGGLSRQKAGVFVCDKRLNFSLIFAGKSGAYPTLFTTTTPLESLT